MVVPLADLTPVPGSEPEEIDIVRSNNLQREGHPNLVAHDESSNSELDRSPQTTSLAHVSSEPEGAASGTNHNNGHARYLLIATWLGVALVGAALTVAIYYGIFMLRLARWTAWKDFRDACIEDQVSSRAS